MLPTIFCTGCGIGSVMNFSLRAIHDLNIDMNKTVFVSGIGCSSRVPGYIYSDGLHSLHGRAIAYATGVKLANPELKVIVFTGDGDCGAIGGNHFLHAIRRNVDITVISINNFIYGMTGGQVAPTTPLKSKTTTTPYGNIEYPIDLSMTAKVIGAPYVARWTTAHPVQCINSIKKALQKTGFSFVEVLSPCPTSYGRLNKMGTALDLTKHFKESTINIKLYEKMLAEGKTTDKMVIGELVDIEKEDFNTKYKRFCGELK
ncbi:MAG TPA: 2-oxoacid:ferredoxin oxidoreductase subunit beta [Candidatus Methanofastidiosum sp.]|nr:2-oxoacid:ferredoxin oxidoreductase subunit beta [Methanofastidiosum sp.]